MEKWPYCAEEIQDGDRFCRHCGLKISLGNERDEIAIEREGSYHTKKKQPGKRKNIGYHNAIVWGVIFALISLVVRHGWTSPHEAILTVAVSLIFASIIALFFIRRGMGFWSTGGATLLVNIILGSIFVFVPNLDMVNSSVDGDTETEGQ